LVRGYGGGLGRYTTDVLDVVIREGRAAAGLPPLTAARPGLNRDLLPGLPLARGFTRRTPGEDAESIERLYRSFAESEQHRLTWRRMLQEGRTEEAQAYLDAHFAAIASVGTTTELGRGQKGPLRVAYDQIQRLQQERRTVEQRGQPSERAPVVDAMRAVARSERVRQLAELRQGRRTRATVEATP